LVKLSDDLIAAGHDCIVMRPDVRYVYQLEACGLRYIGQTKDPLQRYECHLCKDESASVLVVTAAIDNNVAPTMTVLDITDQMSALVVEAFWINRLTCVNKTCSESQYKKWLKDSSKYNCVIAKIQPNH